MIPQFCKACGGRRLHGELLRVLADEYGVSDVRVSQIAKG
jgi:hypothetical protein